jgi:hypothetical protein
VGGSTKAEKVYCMPCFDAHIAKILVKDELDLGLGRRNIVRSRDDIITYGMSYLIC